MTKLTRLKINKFRNVEPVELRFSSGLNVLLGINGSGKTTFLELIAALLSQNISKFRDESFDIEYELSIVGGTIRIHIENQAGRRDTPDDMPPRMVQRRIKADHTLQARVIVDIAVVPLIFTTDANRIAITTTAYDRSGTEVKKYASDSPTGFEDEFLACAINAIANGEPRFDDIDIAALSDLSLLRSLSRFDESLRFFDSILSDTDDLGHEAWITAYTVDPGSPFVLNFDYDDAVGESLIEALNEAANKSITNWRGSETIELPMAKLPFLNATAQLANFKDAKLELRLVEKEVHESDHLDYTNLSFGMLRFWFERHDGSIIPEQKLSYGQKRMLSFLYYLDCNPDIVIADELAAGLHHAWITACLEAIGERQAFLASHDPLLIDEIDLSSIEDVERSFILCRCDTSSGKERLRWSNMSRYDAERFFEAYNVGLQHVSEILRTKRLW